jgi:hypothetical protein
MKPPPRPSVSPLPSYATRFADRPGGREPSVTEMVRDVVAAVQPRWRKKTLRAVFREAREIDRLAEMELGESSESKPSPKSILALAKRMRKLKL